MEWLSTAFTVSETTRQWWVENGAFVFLSLVVFAQWIGLQALLVHYYFFRKNLKRPTPDHIRFSLIERTMALQREQLDRIYTKMAELNKEVNMVAARVTTPVQKVKEQPASIESTYASMGEMNLKKRIQELSN